MPTDVWALANRSEIPLQAGDPGSLLEYAPDEKKRNLPRDLVSHGAPARAAAPEAAASYAGTGAQVRRTGRSPAGHLRSRTCGRCPGPRRGREFASRPGAGPADRRLGEAAALPRLLCARAPVTGNTIPCHSLPPAGPGRGHLQKKRPIGTGNLSTSGAAGPQGTLPALGKLA
jgi:hypothetical protein